MLLPGEYSVSVCVYEASVLGSGCIAAGSWQSGQISTELSTERRAVGHTVTKHKKNTL